MNGFQLQLCKRSRDTGGRGRVEAKAPLSNCLNKQAVPLARGREDSSLVFTLSLPSQPSMEPQVKDCEAAGLVLTALGRTGSSEMSRAHSTQAEGKLSLLPVPQERAGPREDTCRKMQASHAWEGAQPVS